MEKLVVNISGKPKRKTLNNIEYLVAPITMIVSPGVLNGSRGPLFYPPEEVKRSTDSWNNIPITNNHPTTSARSPQVLEECGVGSVFNAKFTDGKLKAEAWVDVEKANSVDPRIVSNMESGNKVEVSTGLNTDNIYKEGVWNETPYKAIAKNYRPDHLAILLDTVGACSVEDGCGLLVNENGETKTVDNKLSHGDIRMRLAKLVREGMSSSPGDSNPSVWVEEVYDKTFIYEINGSYYERGYSKKGDIVTIKQTPPVAVIRKTSFVPIKNECGPECDCSPCKERSTQNGESLIDYLGGSREGGDLVSMKAALSPKKSIKELL